MTENWPIVVVLVILIGLALAALPYRRVSRYRLDRFARRHRLVITIDNGPMVLRYLASVSAWRWAGVLLAGGITCYDAWLRGGEVELDYVCVFVGWFAGAVVAEWRVERMAMTGPRRSAALEPRRLSDYLALWTIWLPVPMFALALAAELVGLVNAPPHRGALVVWLAITVLSAAAIVTVARHVLARPQPMTAADVVAADEARRVASLHVLAASAVAIGAYLVVGVAGLPMQPVHLWQTWRPLVTTLVAAVLPVVAAAATMLARPHHTRRVGTAA